MTTATLLVQCNDRTGIVANLTTFVFEYNGNIIDLDQHSDEETGRFFMRLVWSLENFSLNRQEVPQALRILAKKFEDFRFRLFFSDERTRVAVFCSRQPHCLYDLLLRQQMGEMEGDIVVVLANHPDLREVTEHFALPFVHVAVAPDNRAAAEAEQERVLAAYGVNLIVLARYMQILSPPFCQRWHERIINIHHSFLPAFSGAKPYHQAKERGVKIIGATAHYVTAELDQGPIIEQDVTHVSHRDTVDDMIRKGRDLERQVLARALRAHLQHRVLVERNRTIVFQ